MKKFFFFLAMAFFCTGSWGQDMRDTAWARLLVEEAAELFNARKYEEALGKLDTAEIIYLKTIGKNNLEFINILTRKGLINQLKFQLDTAIQYYKKSIEIEKYSLDDKNLELANTLFNIAFCFYEKGFYNEALNYHLESLEIRLKFLEKNDPQIAISYKALGDTYIGLKNYNSSIENFSKATSIFEQNEQQYYSEISEVYEGLADSYTFSFQFKKAQEYIDLTTKTKKIICNSDSSCFVPIYYLTGNLLLSKFDPDQAIKNYRIALNLLVHDVTANNSWKKIKLLSSLYNNISAAYSFKGDFEKSLIYLFEAAAEREKIDISTVAETYTKIGNTYINLGKFEKASIFFYKSIAILLSYGKRDFKALIDNYSGIASSYGGKGNYANSILYYKKALNVYLSIREEVDSDAQYFKIRYNYEADLFLSIAKSYIYQGDYQEGEYNIKKALNSIKNQKMEDSPLMGECLETLGYLKYLKKETDSAILVLKAALEIFASSHGQIDYLSSVLKYLSSCYEDLGDFEESEKYAAQALNLFNYKDSHSFYRINLPNYILCIKRLGDLHYKWYLKTKGVQHLVHSKEFYLKCDTVFNFLRINKELATNPRLVQAMLKIYENTIAASYFNNTTSILNLQNKEFEYAEKSKSFILFQSIKESNAEHFTNISPEIIKIVEETKIDIAYLEKRLFNRLNFGYSEMDSTNLALRGHLTNLHQKYYYLIKEIEINYPDYYRLKYDLSTVTVEEVQQDLLQPNQTLLEYFVGDSSIFLFVIRQDDYQVLEVKKDFPLDSLVRQIREGITGYYGGDERTEARLQQTTSQYAEAAQELYRRLLVPAEGLLTESLVIVPDGKLGYVPFEALLSGPVVDIADFGAYPFLLKKHQVSYCYSATLLREMMQKQHKKEPAHTLLAFAPFYEKSYEYLQDLFGNVLDAKVAALDTAGWVATRRDFSPLPASGEEVYTASRLWEGDYLLNADATEERFTELASDYRILHLSTHGIADSRVGDYSYLVFAEVPDSTENELLYVRDLYNLQLNADLVVLSACETGVGELQRGEGIISLARAFAYAGAKSIVTSLWVANDTSTKELMNAFYVQLRKGLGKDEALLAAKLHYLEEFPGERAHPFFWAGFVGVGDMRAIR